MPNPFQVGDRVRCIVRAVLGPDFGVVGNIYTVTGSTEIGIRLEELNDALCKPSRFELVTRQVPFPDTTTVTFYTLVYKTRFTTRRIMGFETEEDFNDKKRSILANGGTVFAEKKIKLTNIGAI